MDSWWVKCPPRQTGESRDAIISVNGRIRHSFNRDESNATVSFVHVYHQLQTKIINSKLKRFHYFIFLWF